MLQIYQLGSVIKQANHTVTYFSRKLNKCTEKLHNNRKRTPVCCQNNIHGIPQHFFLGSVIHVHTDHKNLTHIMTNIQHTMHPPMATSIIRGIQTDTYM